MLKRFEAKVWDWYGRAAEFGEKARGIESNSPLPPPPPDGSVTTID